MNYRIMNAFDASNIRSIIQFRELKPNFVKGGDLSVEELERIHTNTLKEMLKEYERRITPSIKAEVDLIFNKFAEPGDNIIILDMTNYDDRYLSDCEDDFSYIDFSGFENKYNKLYYPINIENMGNEEYYQQFIELSNNLHAIGIPTAIENWEDNNSALNEYWYGVIAITKDYKVVDFVIRNDGMLCDENSMESFHNHILKQL